MVGRPSPAPCRAMPSEHMEEARRDIITPPATDLSVISCFFFWMPAPRLGCQHTPQQAGSELGRCTFLSRHTKSRKKKKNNKIPREQRLCLLGQARQSKARSQLPSPLPCQKSCNLRSQNGPRIAFAKVAPPETSFTRSYTWEGYNYPKQFHSCFSPPTHPPTDLQPRKLQITPLAGSSAVIRDCMPCQRH